MDELRVGIIGTGYIARIHAQALNATTGAHLEAVSSRSSTSREQFRSEFAVPRALENAEALLSDETIDAVILCTPNSLHATHAIAALRAGKHVLVEKPMGCSLSESNEMTETAMSTGCVLMVGHMWRFDTEVIALRDQIHTGAIGRVYRTHGYGTHANWGPGGWFTDPDRAWGGSLADMGVHAIDTARFLLGDPLPRRVHAVVGAWTGAVSGIDDTALVTVEWSSGAVSTIESGWWQPHVDAPEAGTRLYGTRGYASLFPTLLRSREDELSQIASETANYGGELPPLTEQPVLVSDRSDHCDPRAYARQMQTFIDAARTRGSTAAGGHEGAVNVAIIEAAYRSAETHQVVELAPDSIAGMT